MYFEHFGLTKSPFEGLASATEFYDHGEQSQISENLWMELDQEPAVVFVTGPDGCGKSQLLHLFEKRAEAADNILQIVPEGPWITSQNLLHSILEATYDGEAPEYNPKEDIFLKINTQLKKLTEEGKTTVLVIDSAERLLTDALYSVKLLSNVGPVNKPLLHIIASASDNFANRLQHSNYADFFKGLRQHYKLVPYTPTQIKDYIEVRLKNAGGNLNLFASDALAEINTLSQGRPAIVNKICLQSCKLAAEAESPQVLLEHVTQTGESLGLYPEPEPEEGAEEGEGEGEATGTPLANVMDPGAQSAAAPSKNKGLWLFIITLALGMGAAIWFLQPNQPGMVSNDAMKAAMTNAQDEEPNNQANNKAAMAANGKADGSMAASDNSNTSSQNDNNENTAQASQTAQQEDMTAGAKPVAQQQTAATTSPEIKAAMASAQETTTETTKASLKDIPANQLPIPFSQYQGEWLEAQIKPGSSLSTSVRSVYGTWIASVEDIVRINNPKLENFSKVYVGQRIRLPKVTPNSLIIEAEGQYYVYLGTAKSESTLSAIESNVKANNIGFDIQTGNWPKRKVFRALAGPFASQADALAANSKLDFELVAKLLQCKDCQE